VVNLCHAAGFSVILVNFQVFCLCRRLSRLRPRACNRTASSAAGCYHPSFCFAVFLWSDAFSHTGWDIPKQTARRGGAHLLDRSLWPDILSYDYVGAHLYRGGDWSCWGSNGLRAACFGGATRSCDQIIMTRNDLIFAFPSLVSRS